VSDVVVARSLIGMKRAEEVAGPGASETDPELVETRDPDVETREPKRSHHKK